MRKTLIVSSILIALGTTACTPSTTGTPTETPSMTTVVASAPTSEQLKNMLRDWHDKGGDNIEVPLVVDLELSQKDGWLTDQFKRDVLRDSVNKDIKPAMAYRPMPDPESQTNWVAFLSAMKEAGQALIEGNNNRAVGDFKTANSLYKTIYDRDQKIFGN